MPLISTAAKIASIAGPLIRKKRILILAAGDKTAAEALKESLERDYQVSIQDILKLSPWTRFLSLEIFRKRKFGRFLSNAFQKAFIQLLSKQSLPHLVISTVPLINSRISQAVSPWDIPFLVVPTDLNGVLFLEGFSKDTFTEKIKIALAYPDSDLHQHTFQKFPVEAHQLAFIGFPVRSLSLRKFSEHDLTQLKTKLHLLENFQTITFALEEVEEKHLFSHLYSLLTFDPKLQNLSVQINLCVGERQKLSNKVRKLLLKQEASPISHSSFMTAQGLVLHLRNATEDLVEVMAASDIVVSSPHCRTINEAIYLQKPLLLDATLPQTDPVLIPFVKKYGFGSPFTDMQQLHMLIPSLLKYPESKEPKKLDLPHFEHHIFKLVKEMID